MSGDQRPSGEVPGAHDVWNAMAGAVVSLSTEQLLLRRDRWGNTLDHVWVENEFGYVIALRADPFSAASMRPGQEIRPHDGNLTCAITSVGSTDSARG